jgi:hypothetical protein
MVVMGVMAGRAGGFMIAKQHKITALERRRSRRVSG